MAELEQFRRHYLKVTERTSLSATEEFHVRQLFDFINVNGNGMFNKNLDLSKVRCPVCQTDFAVPEKVTS